MSYQPLKQLKSVEHHGCQDFYVLERLDQKQCIHNNWLEIQGHNNSLCRIYFDTGKNNDDGRKKTSALTLALQYNGKYVHVLQHKQTKKS